MTTELNLLPSGLRLSPSLPSAPPPVRIVQPANGSTLSLSTPLTEIRGFAPPGHTVAVTIDGSAPVNVMSDGTGRWSRPVPPPPAGVHRVIAQIGTDPPSADNSASIVFTVQAPVADGAATAFTVVSPAHGSTVDSVGFVAGTGLPGANVSVQVDGATPMTTLVDATGQWKVAFASLLPAGPHAIVALSNGASATSHVTVASPSSSGIPDSVYLAGAAALVAWWAWRTFMKKSPSSPVQSQTPVQNPAPGAMVLQSVVVSKDLARTESQAHTIASRFVRGDAGAADETGTSFRFRQRNPNRFVPGSLRTVRPTNGVSMIMGHLQ